MLVIALPYLKTPETDPILEPFFGRQWAELLTISLHNFLSSVFRHMRTHIHAVLLWISLVLHGRLGSPCKKD